jgi:folate-binding protein YgfZ
MIQEISRQAYQAAHTGAAFTDRSDRAWIVLSGKDRASYLHGLFTNDIASLTAGTGCYTAYLTPQGRMIADLWVYELGDVLLLSTAADLKDTILAKLDQFIFTEDVQLGDVSATFHAAGLIGPHAAQLVAQVLEIDRARLEGLPLHGNLRAMFQGQPAIVLRASDLGGDGYDVLVDAAQSAAFSAALGAGGAVPLDPATVETLRVEAGVPKFHLDMTEETIPLEAGIEARAISMTKGCYVGQEVIVRVLHRGHGRVAKRLVGLVLPEDAQPTRGQSVHAGDRPIGSLTSVAWSPELERPIALGYLHRDFIAPGTHVRIEDGDAEVVALPFVPPSEPTRT